MSKQTWNNQSAPSTPSAGNTHLYVDSTKKDLCSLADDGVVKIIRPQTSVAVADQAIAANTNTYITGASLVMAPSLLHAGAVFRWVFCVDKTAGQTGTATPIWTVLFGTGGIISDTARLTFTGVAMTASVADKMQVTLDVLCRSAGAAGVISGVYTATHLGAAATQVTGFLNQPTDVKHATSAGFDTTVANSILGVGVNFGVNTAVTILYANVIGFSM